MSIQSVFFVVLFSLATINCFRSEPDMSLRKIATSEDLQKWKGKKKATVVLFMREDDSTSPYELALAHAEKQLANFNIPFMKVKCSRKFSNDRECRSSEDSAFIYKNMKERRILKDWLSCKSLLVNRILHSILTWDVEFMIDVDSRPQLDQVLHMNKKIFDTVVGSFDKFNSTEMRIFLETAWEIGKNFTFVLASKNVKSKNVQKYGYSVVFYSTLHVIEGTDLLRDDITKYMSSASTLKDIILQMHIAREMESRNKQMRDAIANYEQLKRSGENVHFDAVVDRPTLSKTGAGIPPEERKSNTLLTAARRRISNTGFERLLNNQTDHMAWDAFQEGQKFVTLRFIRKAYSLSESEVRHELHAGRNMALLFYLPWDAKYLLLQEIFDSAKRAGEILTNTKFGEISCYAWPLLCNDFNITTYPTILFLKPKQEPLWYTGALSAQELAEHFSRWTEPLVRQLRQEDVTRSLNEQSHPTIVGVFDETQEESEQSTFKEVAHHLSGGLQFAATFVDRAGLRINNQMFFPPTILVLNARHESGQIAQTNSFNKSFLKNWVQRQALPLLLSITSLNFAEILRLDEPLLLFASSSNSFEQQMVISEIARRMKQEFLTAWMNSSKSAEKEILRRYGVRENGAVVLVNRANKTVHAYGREPARVDHVNLLSWVASCLAAKQEPTYTFSNKVWSGQEGIDFQAMSASKVSKSRFTHEIPAFYQEPTQKYHHKLEASDDDLDDAAKFYLQPPMIEVPVSKRLLRDDL